MPCGRTAADGTDEPVGRCGEGPREVEGSSTRDASIVVERHDGKVAVVVEDDGRGFDPAANGARAADAPGLGLLGVRESVELLGGTVAIESAPGSGTSLFVRIPVAATSNGSPDP